MTAVCVLQPLSLIPKSSTSGLLIVDYPCTCLCLGFSQIILIFPFLLITLHFSQIGFTDDLTFIVKTLLSKRPFFIIACIILNCKRILTLFSIFFRFFQLFCDLFTCFTIKTIKVMAAAAATLKIRKVNLACNAE